MKIFYILDASAFINGFELETNNNYTVPEITEEIKDFESKLKLDNSIKEFKLKIKEPEEQYINSLNKITSESGDSLRLSNPDKKLIALALEMKEKFNVKVISDDYSIQNVLKIVGVPYSGVVTEGIKGVYNWKKVCQGCKKEYSDDYPFDDCEICGSKLFKKRIKL